MRGNPKFKLNDCVKFKLDNVEYQGKVYIVDPYGTFENPSDVSYDIMVDEWGPKKEKCLFKHVTEKLVEKMKIYISLPIKIDEKTVSKRYKEALDYVKKNLPDYEPIGPVNINSFDDNGIKTKREHDYAWYMGEDVKILLRCDAILMCDGWEKSEGCHCEYEVAKVYKKLIFYKFNF